jgi:hypothetical protein
MGMIFQKIYFDHDVISLINSGIKVFTPEKIRASEEAMCPRSRVLGEVALL